MNSNLVIVQIKKYFKLMVRIIATSNYITVKFTSNWWNFELSVFELTMHFKHEMIGIWQRFQRNFELSGTSN